jgi:hypothetical protein
VFQLNEAAETVLVTFYNILGEAKSIALSVVIAYGIAHVVELESGVLSSEGNRTFMDSVIDVFHIAFQLETKSLLLSIKVSENARIGAHQFSQIRLIRDMMSFSEGYWLL